MKTTNTVTLVGYVMSSIAAIFDDAKSDVDNTGRW